MNPNAAATLDAHDEADQVQQQAGDLVARAHSLAVTNDEQYAAAAAFLSEDVKPLLRRINETFDPIVEQAHRAHKTALDAKKKVAEPVLAAERAVKASLSLYAQRQEEARRRREAEIRRAEQERAEREALDRAAELERQGHREEAEAMLDAPIVAAPVVLPPATPKVAGVSTREGWKYRIVDPAKIRREFLVPDEAKIGALVRSMKGAAGELVGGIEVYSEQIVSSR